MRMGKGGYILIGILLIGGFVLALLFAKGIESGAIPGYIEMAKLYWLGP